MFTPPAPRLYGKWKTMLRGVMTIFGQRRLDLLDLGRVGVGLPETDILAGVSGVEVLVLAHVCLGVLAQERIHPREHFVVARDEILKLQPQDPARRIARHVRVPA